MHSWLAVVTALAMFLLAGAALATDTDAPDPMSAADRQAIENDLDRASERVTRRVMARIEGRMEGWMVVQRAGAGRLTSVAADARAQRSSTLRAPEGCVFVADRLTCRVLGRW